MRRIGNLSACFLHTAGIRITRKSGHESMYGLMRGGMVRDRQRPQNLKCTEDRQ